MHEPSFSQFFLFLFLFYFFVTRLGKYSISFSFLTFIVFATSQIGHERLGGAIAISAFKAEGAC